MRMPTSRRSFLFLQGPFGPFFYRLGKALQACGCDVRRVVTNGGDWVFWPACNVSLWRGKVDRWPLWIGECMDRCRATDMVLMGDWRALHREAILLARMRGMRIWVYEEGYLRPRFVTLEEGGVNGYSPLPRDPGEVRARARGYAAEYPYPLSTAGSSQRTRTYQIMKHYAGVIAGWPLFPHYHTHRPDSAIRELSGIIPRYFTRKRRNLESLNDLRHFLQSGRPFYFMPLQLDSDAQIRRHSPFTGVRESLSQVIASFARHAPRDCCLLFKNHPFDNGLIDYRGYIRSMGMATGCAERLVFVEAGKADMIIRRSLGVVLCNSTVGLSALQLEKPVYCLGNAIYAMPGLAANAAQIPLDAFWTACPAPDMGLLADFLRLLAHEALLPGNFYSDEGIRDVVEASLVRMQVKEPPAAR